MVFLQRQQVFFSFIIVVAIQLVLHEIHPLNRYDSSSIIDGKKKEEWETLGLDSHHNNRQRRKKLMPSFNVEEFLTNFVAANPNYTEDCKAYLRSPQAYNRNRTDRINWRWRFSQYNQDWFMFVNFFHQYVTTGKRGFYVESGTNHWFRVSNTALYDFCLGWDGLCIEPTKKYHGQITQRRTCRLVTHCLSDRKETIKISKRENPGVKEGTEVECLRLDSILDKYNITNVDLWSLDVEGFEFKALAGLDFTKYHIQGLLMEQQDVSSGTCAQFPIDYRLTMLGYAKYRIVSDGFYWKSNPHVQYPNKTAMDGWFLELEQARCKKQGYNVTFFTDKM